MEKIRKRLENKISLFGIQKGWFSLPDMKDPEKNRRAQLLWRIMLGLIFSSLLVLFLSLLRIPMFRSAQYIALAILLFSLFIMLNIRWGYITLVSWIFFIAAWLFIGVVTLFSWGVQPVFLFGQTIIIFMAILLLGEAAGYLFFLLSLGFMIVLLNLPLGWQSDFGISPALVQLPFSLMWLWYTVVGMIVITLTRTSMMTSLTNARTLEQRFRSLFESINDAVFVITFDLRILSVNHRAARMVGYEALELMKMGLSDIMSLENFDIFMRIRDQILSEQSISVFEIELNHVDNHKINIEASIGAVRDDDGNPQYFQVIARDITERTRLQARVQRSLNEMALLARTDMLTGLLNRRAIEELGEVLLLRAVETKKPISVVMIDMDDLKEINDRYGHYSGDQAIIYLSTLLLNLVGDHAHVARWGGDEFLVLVPNEDMDAVWMKADGWRKQLTDQQMAVDLNLIDVKVSMGVATFIPKDDPIGLDTLVKWADQALYDAKEKGKNNVGRFET